MQLKKTKPEIVYTDDTARNEKGELKYPDGTGPFFGNREGARGSGKPAATGDITDKERSRRRSIGKRQRIARKRNR